MALRSQLIGLIENAVAIDCWIELILILINFILILNVIIFLCDQLCILILFDYLLVELQSCLICSVCWFSVPQILALEAVGAISWLVGFESLYEQLLILKPCLIILCLLILVGLGLVCRRSRGLCCFSFFLLVSFIRALSRQVVLVAVAVIRRRRRHHVLRRRCLCCRWGQYQLPIGWCHCLSWGWTRMGRVHVRSAPSMELRLRMQYIPAWDLGLLKVYHVAEVLIDQELINIDCWVEKRRWKLPHRSSIAGSTILCHIHYYLAIEICNLGFK